jgi:hypothetical protein
MPTKKILYVCFTPSGLSDEESVAATKDASIKQCVGLPHYREYWPEWEKDGWQCRPVDFTAYHYNPIMANWPLQAPIPAAGKFALTFILALFLSVSHVAAQAPDSIAFSWSAQSFGYRATGKLDTVPAVLLVTDGDNSPARSTSGFAVRREYGYSGDRMPTMPPTNYENYWTVFAYLTHFKFPFPAAVTVWDYRLK